MPGRGMEKRVDGGLARVPFFPGVGTGFISGLDSSAVMVEPRNGFGQSAARIAYTAIIPAESSDPANTLLEPLTCPP